jgi:hypothetical protein
VIAAQYGLDTLAGDVGAVKSALAAATSPCSLTPSYSMSSARPQTPFKKPEGRGPPAASDPEQTYVGELAQRGGGSSPVGRSSGGRRHREAAPPQVELPPWRSSLWPSR